MTTTRETAARNIALMNLMMDMIDATQGRKINAIKAFRSATLAFTGTAWGLKPCKSIQDVACILYAVGPDGRAGRATPMLADVLEALVIIGASMDDASLDSCISSLAPDLTLAERVDIRWCAKILANPEAIIRRQYDV